MIRTKVAQIISPTRVVLAAGAEQGVREGMEFIIYDLSDTIVDPDTKEPLGQLELHKGRVKVILVQDKLSTADTFLRKVYRPTIHELIGVSKGWWMETPELLPVEESATAAAKTDLTVRVGDLARNVS